VDRTDPRGEVGGARLQKSKTVEGGGGGVVTRRIVQASNRGRRAAWRNWLPEDGQRVSDVAGRGKKERKSAKRGRTQGKGKKVQK